MIRSILSEEAIAGPRAPEFPLANESNCLKQLNAIEAVLHTLRSPDPPSANHGTR
jgi:hypothetical protein